MDELAGVRHPRSRHQHKDVGGVWISGGDDNLNKEHLWTIQAMIALGHDEEKIRVLDRRAQDKNSKGLILVSNNDNYFGEEVQQGRIVVNWDRQGDAWKADELSEYGVKDPHWRVGFPAMALLAHELEHAYQDVRGQGNNYFFENGQINYDVASECEVQAMEAENVMAYAFYKKVPGYGIGGLHEIHGPRLYYNAGGTSPLRNRLPYEVGPLTWADYGPDFHLLY